MYYPLNHMKFGFAASYYDMERAGVKLFAEKYGKKAICAMSQDTDFGRDVMDGARDQLKAMNMQLVAETMHKPTDTDFSASVAKLHDAEVRSGAARHHRARHRADRLGDPQDRAGTWTYSAISRSTTCRWRTCRAA